jgi:hypothetical protein
MELTEIRDPNGKVLGYYMPIVPSEVMAMYEKAQSLFDMEQAKQAAATEHGRGRPLAEIMQALRANEAKVN